MLGSLINWILTAAIPAGSVISFFWNGDGALSPEFKQWLSEKITGAKLTVPEISSIDTLGRVFSFVYGRQYFGLNTLLRVAAISILAFIVSTVAVFRSFQLAYVISWLLSFGHGTFFLLLVINIIFDYLSITKSRLLIDRSARIASSSRAMSVILLDLILTAVLVAIYFAVTVIFAEIMRNINFGGGAFGHVGGVEFGRKVYRVDEYDYLLKLTHTPFFITISLTFVLTVLYSLAFLLLRLLGYVSNTFDLVKWILPVQTLPVRSIGIIAGILLFLFLEIYHAAF